MLEPRTMDLHIAQLTPAAIHAARREARRTLVGLRTLRAALGSEAFATLRLSLREFIDSTAESRDAEVQRALVQQLVARLAPRPARQCRDLLRRLAARRSAALGALVISRVVGAVAQQHRHEQLRQLRRTQSTVDLPQRAARRYRRTLRVLDAMLTKRIENGRGLRRLHRLRIRLRGARDLAQFFYERPGVGAQRLLNELDAMQEALGELHDGLLLSQWAGQCEVAVPKSLQLELDAHAQRRLARIRHHRKLLRRAIHRYLRKTHP